MTAYFHMAFEGNVGSNPEMRYTPTGQAVTSFSVAHNREYMVNDEKVKETIWFRVSAGGKQAEVCNQYVKKGQRVIVEGRLVPDKATGSPKIWKKQNGDASASFDVNANFVRFLSPRQEGEQPAGDAVPAEDNLPF